ncbi:hypothetical protein Dtox_2226 [Desulfofarcimen acetoxidans DSM 771]|uniref:Uncharacterized protein n=1 Tax=Desulfofarcimen acetoxidans (strain ATCC 49208 / DSM 771 / KCTC 5769 / VKM B-1644 / 5575) TaxID=485916 RepID=C8VZR5_DESAS|nr:hypothetical protein [Desulfofarcimen acetoxidans]ACV63043.1 hypothetical protein Dtox_2226 [Desulfofarcimen acetoxidans DSM 771]
MLQEVEQFREDMLIRLYYIQLVMSLTPKGHGSLIDKSVKQAIIDLGDFLKNCSDQELDMKRDSINELLVNLYNNYKQYFKPKKGMKRIGLEFNELFKSNQDLYLIGIEYGWLDERLDFLIPLPENLPYHTKIGIGHHAYCINIEEEFLIRDAFFMLVNAEKIYKRMHLLASKYKTEDLDIDSDEERELFSNFNQTISTYSRLGLLSFYSFIEAFINSVGYDYALRNKNHLTDSEREILLGKKKGSYISLEYKIEKYQEIIRDDKKSIIKTLDMNQMKEPFLTLLTQIKGVRDSSVHYSPVKEKIWNKPDEWISKIKITSQLSVEAAIQFWNACYPQKELPEYLHKLNYEKHYSIAERRLSMISDS